MVGQLQADINVNTPDVSHSSLDPACGNWTGSFWRGGAELFIKEQLVDMQ